MDHPVDGRIDLALRRRRGRVLGQFVVPLNPSRRAFWIVRIRRHISTILLVADTAVLAWQSALAEASVPA